MARILRSKSSNLSTKKNRTITTSCGDNSRDIVKDIIASIPSCYRARMFTSIFFLTNKKKSLVYLSPRPGNMFLHDTLIFIDTC